MVKLFVCFILSIRFVQRTAFIRTAWSDILSYTFGKEFLPLVQNKELLSSLLPYSLVYNAKYVYVSFCILFDTIRKIQTLTLHLLSVYEKYAILRVDFDEDVPHFLFTPVHWMHFVKYISQKRFDLLNVSVRINITGKCVTSIIFSH